MSTVFYKNVVDDVKEKGYVAISHVWGEQTLYSADKFGINSGVNWIIPLSNTNKISKLVKIMNHFKNTVGLTFCVCHKISRTRLTWRFPSWETIILHLR
jgi:hypothetical protein